MPETIFDCPYLSIGYENEEGLMTVQGKPESESMAEGEFRYYVMELRHAMLDRRPALLLIDQRELHYVIDPHLQSWLAEEFFSLDCRPERLAAVEHAEYVCALSMRQTLAEDETPPYPYATRYFDETDAARAWLLGS